MESKDFLEEYRQKLWVSTDGLFRKLLLFQWIAAIVISLFVSPYAWSGSQASVHTHVWAAIFLGGILISFPVYATIKYPGSSLSRHSVAVGQMLFSGLLIHLSGGRIETHFHIFGSLAFLAFYRDWKVIVTASAVTAIDHIARGIFWPESIYGIILGSEWRTIEHVLWVVFIDLFLIRSCVSSSTEMKEIAKKQNQLNDTVSKLKESSISKKEADNLISEIKKTIECEVNNLKTAGELIHSILVNEEKLASARASAISQTTAATEELHRSSEQSSVQAGESAEESQRLFQVAEEGGSLAKTAMIGMSELTEKFSMIGGEINTLCEKVSRIKDIAAAVREIADRTNLLALNAAVEAARAGDHGRGFSVVATSIRQLADHSRNSMDELKEVIEDINGASKNTVRAAEEGAGALDHGVSLVKQAGDALGETVAHLQKITLSSSQIQYNTKEQTVALDQIKESMNGISQGTNETVKGISETRKAVDKINSLAEKLHGMVH